MMSLKIKLWFSLTAALPFSSDGQHPVFTWTTSLVCGHFLGKLFSDLVLGPEKVNEVDERTESRSESESKTGKIPKARSNERLQNKRQKYLRKLMQRRHINNLSFTEKCRNEYEQDQEGRKWPETYKETVLKEASTTLAVIWSDYLSSAKYKKVLKSMF